MSAQTEWHDLETKGFVVVPSFLSAAEMEGLLDDFRTGTPPSAYPHGFKLISRRPLDRAWARIDPVLKLVRETTSLEVDLLNFLTMSHYIDTSRTERTSYLHQDFDLDYRLTRDHINYLNFWIPIAKPERERSNVTVVPFDALKARSPAAFDFLVGSGGHRLIPKDGTTNVFGNYGQILAAGEEGKPALTFDFDIEEVTVTPPLSAGDLLLMRGDLVHRTQDSSTPRTAASIRVTHSRKTITRERVGDRPDETAGAATDPAAKLNASLHRCLDAFESAGKPTITIQDFVDFSSGVRPKEK